MFRKLIKNEKGMAAFYGALLIPVLLALSGLLIDGGYLMYTKIRLEGAVDSAAMATKNAYDPTLWEEEGIVELDQIRSEELAKQYLAVNYAEAKIDECTVDPDKKNVVKVTGSVEIEPLFMSIFGYGKQKIKATVYNHVG